ncbi:minor capsid protein [Cytobacillus oceanisediminis]|uniref:minor capsid protein n=1 Tax=Cytobacillus oceanisediminis TaxID=665099 RepID=UPI00207B0776|nr:minor capsid protein [Cytobacillus oceanisediminis]USK43535.1 minor capsid protein [Cytobacillus oceanisediminis]
MDFIKQISNYLKKSAPLNAPLVSPILSSDASSVAIRETPSSVGARYINKGKTLQFQFQILVKDPSILKARETINGIFTAIDGLPSTAIKSADGSFLMTKCECSTLPSWVETNERNEHIYTAIFNAELEMGG